MKHLTTLAVVAVFAAAGAASSMGGQQSRVRKQEAALSSTSEVSTLQSQAARFAPVDIGADVSRLPENERRALARLVQAGWVMDSLFLRQVWGGNPGLLMQLMTDGTPLGRARLHYFRINKGPWSRLDGNAAFVPGVPEKPEGANFYPAGAPKADIEAWMKKLPDDQRALATGFFTVIRRSGEGFAAVPYSVEYEGELWRAATLLREAASLTAQPTLKTFLNRRADAFISNDYYDSDVAWMELDASIEPTIGPYEVYEDEFFNYKAAFEGFITIRDDAESAKLQKFAGELQDIENHLPVDPQYRNPKLGGMAPIRVVNELLASGDGNRAVQTAAFNLPNDERIVREKGAKRVMLKNVQDAKFSMVLVPISKIVLAPADQSKVAFDAFFTHIVMHELMHGLGPHQITVGGRATTVRQELRETYSSIEEAKADISGLFALQHLVDKGVIDKSMESRMYDTFLASAFRSIRFGIGEAHGRAVALQLNYLTDNGAFTVRQDGTFAVNQAKVKDGVVALTRELLTLEAQGDYVKAKEMLAGLAVVRPGVKKLLDKLGSIPVDIEPRFTTARQLVDKYGK